MYCPNCGCYNDENAAFCGSCGTPLRTEQSGREQPGQTAGAVPPYPGGQEMKRMEGGAPTPPVQKKKKGKKIWLILAAVLVVIAAAVAAVFLWILPQQKVKQYNSLVAEGNRYLEEMDYEKAEDAFLEAIEIEPKKAEPYVRLADLYLDTGETEKAKQIITEAKETLPEEEREEIEKLEEERKDELDGEDPVEEEKVEEELPFDQEYWIIFREGFRENRIEMSTVDSDMDRQDLCIIWDGGLTLNITDGMSECDQYYLNSAGEWKQIGEYNVLSNYATEVIASNLDVYDSAGNLIVSKTDYSDVDIDELVAETAGNTGEDENSVGFSDEDLQGIAASLGVPEDVNVEVTVSGDPYYWDAGQRWLVNVEVYQDGNFVAGAAVDRDTKEPIRNIYNYNP